jgi:hypothetical protein
MVVSPLSNWSNWGQILIKKKISFDFSPQLRVTIQLLYGRSV